MKKIIIFFTLLISIHFNVISQEIKHTHIKLNEKVALETFRYTNFINEFSEFASNKGYDFKKDECLRNFFTIYHSMLLNNIFELYQEEKNSNDYLNLYNSQLTKFQEYLPLFTTYETSLRREYERRLISAQSASKVSGPLPTPQAACTNMDIETGNLSGWTTNSANVGPSFSNFFTPGGANSAFASTPGPDAAVAAINKVYRGSFSACIDVLGSGNGVDWRELQQTFLVSNANKDFVFYVAVITDGGAHACVDNPFFKVNVVNSSNVVIPCSAVSLIGSATGGVTCSQFTGWSTAGFYDFLNWTPVIVPLGGYIGQNVTIKFRVQRCTAYGHGARAYIEANCNPAALTATGNLICPGKSVNLNAPLIQGYSYNWSGPSSFAASTASVNPTLSGVYTVTMALTSNPACKMVLDTVLTSVPSPTANFNYTVTPCAPINSVPVMSTSTPAAGDPISSYTWVWGDATVNGSGSSNSHIFAAAGTKTVELKIVSGNGCRDSIKKSFSFTPGPLANFNAPSTCLNTPTNFTNTSTSVLPIVSHTWDFGDGTPNGSGPNPSHSYTSSGIKSITYTVTNTSGCSNVFTKTITISPKPNVSIGSNTVCLNLTTVFTNSSTVSAPDNITIWAWDFDNNGTTDNLAQFPTNTFTTGGTHTVELKATTNNGCSDSTTISVLVNAIQTAVFTANNVCLNSSISIVNTTTVTPPDFITAYNWNFGAGANPPTATGYNPTLPSYSSSGTKTITLNLTANTSCTVNLVKTIQVYAQPVANFSATSVCQSTTSVFTDLSTSTGSITAWAWDFTNNGSVDNTTNAPTTIYPTSGTFSASLIVTDNNSCKDTVILPINVWGHAIPNFNPTTVCFGSISTFSNITNTTTNNNVGGTPTWGWNFGDGSAVSTLQNPTHSYTSTVIYTYSVALTATTTNNCIDNIVKTVTVNVLPTATFTPVNACMNSNVLLNNTSSIAAPDNISNYLWNFGSGSVPTSTSTIQNPALLTYNSSGIKTITLTITANTTCTASITNTVNIYPQPVANFSTTSVCQSAATAFTDLSTPTGSITAWAWDFTNNGSIDNATNAPSNVYPSSGTFSASLIVTSSNNCKDTVTLPINVWGHTIPNFTPDKVCFGTSSAFTNLTNETTNNNVGSGTTYIWNFADGSATTNLNGPSHTYTLGGNANAIYNVTLTATSIHNCADKIIKLVNVYATPTASFTSDSVCLGLPSQMTNASNGNGNTVNTYVWDFLSDGSIDISGISNPSFTFPAIGNNNVTYTVSTTPVVGLVCSNTTNTITVWVNPKPVPDFTFVNKCINAQPNTFNGLPSTIAIGTNTAYAWAYGDGAVSSPTSASASSHIYAAAGVYNASLTVTSNKGCQTVIAKQVEVYRKPFMSVANSSACDQSAMTFTAVAQPNSATAINWFWDFNNTISTIEGAGQTSSFVFPGPGAQTVALISETSISAGGCKDTVKKIIYVNYVPVPLFSVDKPSGCPVHCVKFTDLTTSVAAPAKIKQWQWTLGDGTVVTNPTNAAVSHCYTNNSSNQLAKYDIKLLVTTDSGCVNSINKLSYINVYPKPIANYTVNPNPGNVVTPLEYFTNQSQDYTKWWWIFGDNSAKDSVNVDPTHFYSEITATTYYSVLLVANQYGCLDTAYVPVEIGPEFTFYIPNAFTPSNEDGINDYFTGMGIGIAKYEMWVFDRWGEKIFYTDDINKGWNGKVQGKFPDGKQDVYIWKVKLKDVLGKMHEYIGHVTILK